MRKKNGIICLLTLLLSMTLTSMNYDSTSIKEEVSFYNTIRESSKPFPKTTNKVEFSLENAHLFYKPSGLPVDPSKVKVKLKECSGFGKRFHPILKVRRMHNGVDFPADVGTSCLATLYGTVKKVSTSPSKGKYLEIESGDGKFTIEYFHCDSIMVNEGTPVLPGQEVCTVGNTGLSTGPHLHYGVKENGVYVNPIGYIVNI